MSSFFFALTHTLLLKQLTPGGVTGVAIKSNDTYMLAHGLQAESHHS
jgi:hypothetical protein